MTQLTPISFSRQFERIAYGVYKRLTFVNKRKWHYLKVLARIHEIVAPARYFEIGVRRGHSFALAACPAVGVDPSYDLLRPPRNDDTLVRVTSDAFFASDAGRALLGEQHVDLAFIDGWHNSEFVLRDFMNTERYCSPRGAIVLDDVLPRTTDQAVRVPHGRAWTGDVWKVATSLSAHRPDLLLTFIDCLPAGLLVIHNLDPTSRILVERYPEIELELLDPIRRLMPPRSYSRAFVSPEKGLASIAKSLEPRAGA